MTTSYFIRFQDGKTASLQLINDRFTLAQPALTDDARAALCMFLTEPAAPKTVPLKRGDEVLFSDDDRNYAGIVTHIHLNQAVVIAYDLNESPVMNLPVDSLKPTGKRMERVFEIGDVVKVLDSNITGEVVCLRHANLVGVLSNNHLAHYVADHIDLYVPPTIEGKPLPPAPTPPEPEVKPIRRQAVVSFNGKEGIVVDSTPAATGVLFLGDRNITTLDTKSLIDTGKNRVLRFLPGDPVTSLGHSPSRIFLFVNYKADKVTLDNGHKLVEAEPTHLRPTFDGYLVDVVKVKGIPRPELRTMLTAVHPEYQVKSGDASFKVDRPDFYLTSIPAEDHKQHKEGDEVLVPYKSDLAIATVVKQERAVVTISIDEDPDSPLYYTANCPIKVLPREERIAAVKALPVGGMVRFVAKGGVVKVGEVLKITKHHTEHNSVELSNGLVLGYETVQPH